MIHVSMEKVPMISHLYEVRRSIRLACPHCAFSVAVVSRCWRACDAFAGRAWIKPTACEVLG